MKRQDIEKKLINWIKAYENDKAKKGFGNSLLDKVLKAKKEALENIRSGKRGIDNITNNN